MTTNPLPTRHLGDLSVSALGYGCMGLSGAYGPADQDAARRTLLDALEAGVTLLDTADFYGNGDNETLIGSVLAGRSDHVVIATKTGVVRTPEGMRLDGSPEHLGAACDASLGRLGVEQIDLFTLARVDPSVPIEDSVGAIAELVVAGKVGHVGLSEVSPSTLRRAHAVHPITALQSEYSLWERGVENAILTTCRELGVGFTASSPLGRGFLTNATPPTEFVGMDQRRNHPRFQPDNVRANTAMLAPAAALADRLGITVGQLCLAWLLHQGDDIVPIPGTRSTSRVRENIGSLDVHLTTEDLMVLNETLPVGATAGARYPDALMATLDSEAS